MLTSKVNEGSDDLRCDSQITEMKMFNRRIVAQFESMAKSTEGFWTQNTT
jgi:hypothetical protein